MDGDLCWVGWHLGLAWVRLVVFSFFLVYLDLR